MVEQVLRHLDVDIPVHPAIITPPIRNALASGTFETEEAAELAAIVEPGDRVLEIGAGIGFISTLLARLPEVERVVAVEANPNLMPFMADVHARNRVSKVRRINAVLSNGARGTQTFYLREDFWMGSIEAGPNPYCATVEVPTENLDALLRDEAITMIVCDVEGAESMLFEDADLARVTRIHVELHDHITGLKGIGKLFAAMLRKGFTYDPRHSSRQIVLFRRVEENEVLRPFKG